jgi:hypothetical protein
MAVAHGPRALRGYVAGGLGVKIAASGHRNGLASGGILSGKNSRDERVRCARSATVASLIARRDGPIRGLCWAIVFSARRIRPSAHPIRRSTFATACGARLPAREVAGSRRLSRGRRRAWDCRAPVREPWRRRERQPCAR